MIRILQVGYGEMARRHHLPLVARMPLDAKIVGIVRSRNSETTECGAACFTNLNSALKATRPDLTVISTPHSLHGQAIRAALEADSHIYVEKPIALTYDESAALVSKAERRGKLMVVGLQRRYEGFCSVARELKTKGKLGDVRLANGFFSHRFQGLEGWRLDQSLAGEGILHDSSFHLLDTLLYITGLKNCVLTGATILRNQSGLPHSFSVILEGDSGLAISATASYLAPAQSVQEEYSIYGDDGGLFARRFCKDHNTDPPKVFWKSANGSEKCEFDLCTKPWGRQLPLQALINVLSGRNLRESLLSEGAHTLETHRAIDLIIRSARRKFFPPSL